MSLAAIAPKGVVAVLATMLSALLYALAFWAPGFRALAWVSLVPLLLALRGRSLGGAMALGFLWGELAMVAATDALPWAISNYFLQPLLVGWLFALLAWGLLIALYNSAFACAYRLLADRYVKALPFLVAAAWTAMELGRGRLFATFGMSNPWGLLGYSQVGFDCMTQIASLTGVYGISFVLATSNAAIAELILCVYTRRPLRGAQANVAIAGLLSVAALAYGWLELREADQSRELATPVPVALVQGNLDLGARWQAEFFGRNLDDYLDLTLAAIEAGPPEIVFWPENSLTFHLDEEPLLRDAIASVLSKADVELIAGGPSTIRSDPPRYQNSVFVMNASGDVRSRYDKQILLPFAEYLPFPGIDFVRRSFSIRSFSPGGKTALPETRAGPAGILVCNEAMLPEAAGERVRRGATYLASPSNDSWIAKPRFAEMMLNLVSLRAVEQRRYLVRVSTSGPSAIVDPWGRMTIRSELSEREILLGAIRPRTNLTLYARIGDLFALACLASVLAALGIRWQASRRGL